MNKAMLVGAGLLFAVLAAHGEQVKRFGDWRVHYIAFNASVLSAEVAERYDIVRGSHKALVNITAVGPSGRGEKVTVRGKFKNLLDQSKTLDFREIDDKGTVYYLAAFDFEHAENLRFEVTVDLPKHGTETFRFQQPLYRDGETR
ncbi:MAG: DUF4426 domain-containing protein [Gammaproteobacteria bacterium]|nr:DUF4426 domain-containing protein [Gammaproteobacteria bacterium]